MARRPEKSSDAEDLFPQRALLLGTLWFPATFLMLLACMALGWWSAHHMETALAAGFAAIFLLAATLQGRFVIRAIVLLRARADTRLPLNYVLLVMGMLTVVLAAGFAFLFSQVAATG